MYQRNVLCCLNKALDAGDTFTFIAGAASRALAWLRNFRTCYITLAGRFELYTAIKHSNKSSNFVIANGSQCRRGTRHCERNLGDVNGPL